MLHHVEIYVSNLDASHAFWTPLLARVGYVESGRWDDGFTLAHDDDAYLTFVQVADKHALRRYHRCGVGLNHLAFRVKDRDAVDMLRQFCQESGFSCLYDERYPYANGGSDYYALFIEDPDRIKVEFVAAEGNRAASTSAHCCD
jgi:catechol 2,3-dioxygenase-like lactoylglutathione lyase family enzyme